MIRTRIVFRRVRAPAVPWLIGLCLASTACLRPVHEATGERDAPPGRIMRLVEETPGRGSPIRPGDRVKVDLVGTYGDGREWANGPFSYIYHGGAYPGARSTPRVGARFKLEWLRDGGERTERRVPLVGLDGTREGYMVRRDRGAILIEHRIRSWCRPMKLFLLPTGFGPFEIGLGCWRYPRLAAPSAGRVSRQQAYLDSMEYLANMGVDPVPGGGLGSPPPPPDPALVEAARHGDLHSAAVLARPERVSELLRAGADPEVRDSIGMTVLLRVAFTSYPGHPYVAAAQPRFLAVVDTLLAHGASVTALAEKGARSPMYGPEELVIGNSSLDFAARFCDDGMVRRLIDAGGTVTTGPGSGFVGAVIEGCPEVVSMLLEAGTPVAMPGLFGGTPIERLAAVGSFHEGHVEVARLLLAARADPSRAREHLKSRLDDPGPGGFGFTNRAVARRILALMR